MNSAARIVTNTRKFDHGLMHVRHDTLHWLDVPERVTFKLCMIIYKCLHGMGLLYLSEMCQPISSEAGRRHLLTTAGRRAFSCAGPSVWNSLPVFLRDESLTLDTFKRSLKCFLFATYWYSTCSALEIFNDSVLYKFSLNNNNNNNLQRCIPRKRVRCLGQKTMWMLLELIFDSVWQRFRVPYMDRHPSWIVHMV